uniref:protein-tyrosine-phosphatase n=1 Tax=Parastrongyloides trichosuri TaxID=131310 RepID=A0A0N4ZCE5_PARTI
MTTETQTETYGSKEKGPTKILNFLYLGSQADALNNEILKKYDIKAILNITIPCIRPDKELIKDSNFLNIELKDNFTEKILPHFEKAFEFIDKQRDLKHNVLIHCLAGISRSATFCIAYLMKHLSVDHSCAYSYVKKLRASISPNFNFLGQLFEYETNLKKIMTLKHEIPILDINYTSSSACANESKNNILKRDAISLKDVGTYSIANETKFHFLKNKNGKRLLQQGPSVNPILRPSILSFDRTTTIKNNLRTNIPGTDKFSPSTEFANISLRTFTEEPLTKIPLTYKEEEEEETKIDANNQSATSSTTNTLTCENPTFGFTSSCLSYHENFIENKRKNYLRNIGSNFFDDIFKKNGKRMRRRLNNNSDTQKLGSNELNCNVPFVFNATAQNESSSVNQELYDKFDEKMDSDKHVFEKPYNPTSPKKHFGENENKGLMKSKSSVNVEKEEQSNCQVLRKSLTLIFNTENNSSFSLDQSSNKYNITPQTPSSRPMFLSMNQSQSSTTSTSNETQTSNHINGRDPDRDSIGSNSSHEITVN